MKLAWPAGEFLFFDSKRQRTYPISRVRALSNDFHRERSESCALRTSGFDQIRELLPDCVHPPFDNPIF
jgi:hypothetical protein